MPEQLEFNLEYSDAFVAIADESLTVNSVVASEDRESLCKLLQERLSSHANRPVHLHITDNTSTLISAKPAPFRKSVQLRLHHMFLQAPPEVVQAVASWALNPDKAEEGALIDAYIEENRHHIRTKQRRSFKIRSKGVVHDLGLLYAELNQHHFGTSLNVSIGWAKMPQQRRRYSIRFGSYYPEQNQIRMHPLLDQPFVPQYFVRYIIYHEMLHAFLGVEETGSGRRRIHTKRFNELEQAYPDYDKAITWMDNPKNLKRLLRKSASKALSNNILQLGER